MKLSEAEKKLFKNCAYCSKCGKCTKHADCEYLWPPAQKRDNDQINTYIEMLRIVSKKSKDHKMRSPTANPMLSSSGGSTLYEYYVRTVNDCLSQIRNGLIAYAYNLDVVKTIINYEPDVKIQWRDGVFYISL